MNKYKCSLIFIGAFLMLQNLYSQTPTGWPGCDLNFPYVYLTANNCYSGGWILVFEDHFNEPQINTDKWIPRTPWGNQPNISTYVLPENIVLENGNANLKVLKEPGNYPVPWWNNTNPTLTWYDYTGAEMWSIHQFQYGRYEIKCTLPRGVGYWPAFWLYGSTPNQSSEIDVFEFWNEWYSYWLNWINWNKMSRNQHMSIHHCDADGSTENMGWEFWTGSWIFSIEWDPFTVKWFVKEDGGGDEVLIREDFHFIATPDGPPISNCTEIDPGMLYRVNIAFPTLPMNVIADFCMGIDEGGPNNSTPDEGSFTIDYIKVFRKNNCDDIIQKCSMGNLSYYPTQVYAKDIIFGNDLGNCLNEIQGKDIDFLATNEVILKPNFDILPSILPLYGNTTRYSVFNAEIIGCNQTYSLTNEKIDTNLQNQYKEKPVTNIRTPAFVTDDESNTVNCGILPNPSHGDFNIIFSQPTFICKLELVNQLGVTIMRETDISKNYLYNFKINAPCGLYILYIYISDNKVIQRKILIN